MLAYVTRRRTSLLAEVQRRAQARNALTAFVTGGDADSIIDDVRAALYEETAGWRQDRRRRFREALGALDVSVTAGVPGVASVEVGRPARDEAPARTDGRSRVFERALRDAAAVALDEQKSGLVLLIDEIQEADATGLRTLAYAWQSIARNNPRFGDLPAVVIAAGLPNSREVIVRAASSSERFEYSNLGPLSDGAAASALTSAARELGVIWKPDAVAEAVSIAGGYAHTVQLLGDYSWAQAGYPDPGSVIELSHVLRAQEKTEAELAEMFSARLDKLAPASWEYDMVVAMAHLGDGPVAREDVARLLRCRSREDLSQPRKRLLSKGIVTESSPGHLEFSIAGFARHVRDNTDVEAAVARRRRPPAGT